MTFPTTQGSAIAGLRDPARAQRSWQRVSAAYWRPVYKHLRLQWRKSPEDAEDLTQAFFTVAFEKEYLGDWDSGRARFRTYLKTCVDRFASKAHARAHAQKRSGATVELEAELAAEPVADAETVFEREWPRSVFTLAVEALKAQHAGTPRLAAFERHDLADVRPSYADVAASLGVPVTTVTNHLAFMRRALREQVVEVLRELTADEAELQDEVRALLR